jgi:hypothetical protein
MLELYLHCPIRFHGVVHNQLSTGIILPFFRGVFCYHVPNQERALTGSNIPISEILAALMKGKTQELMTSNGAVFVNCFPKVVRFNACNVDVRN